MLDDDDEYMKIHAQREEELEEASFCSLTPDLLGDEFPLSDYGLGIEGYFRFVQKMCMNIFWWSLAAILLVWLYKSNGHLEGAGMYDPIAQMSLGNLEGTNVECLQTFYGIKRKSQKISCSKGTIGNFKYYGVIAHGENQTLKRDIPASNKLVQANAKIGNNYCGKHTWLKPEDDCTSEMFDKEAFKKEYTAKCLGEKKECSITLNDPKWIKDATSNTKCNNKNSRIYLQTECTLKNSELVKDKTIAIIAMFIMLLVSAFYYERIREYQKNRRAQKTRNDFVNCTIGDYSIRIKNVDTWYND